VPHCLISRQSDLALDRPHITLGEYTLVNLSVWKNVQSLNQYVYESAHLEIMRRRKEWFDRMPDAYVLLWWVGTGHRPTPTDAIEKLELLRKNGPTSEAFTFRRSFMPPSAPDPDTPKNSPRSPVVNDQI
jgi:hypothetical protein